MRRFENFQYFVTRDLPQAHSESRQDLDLNK